jgi:endonuclease/exonuclease/phosphatase family metal-dependent hydrolase
MPDTPAYKILMSNLGYLRGISGRLFEHIRYLHRHIHCSVEVQKTALKQLAQLIETENPDICCFVEIDQGSSDCANFNQLEALISDAYPYSDIENKYGQASKLRHRPRSKGKSNAFMAKHPVPYEKIYFIHGTKRLIYKIILPFELTVFFTHFSLQKNIRAKQFWEIRQLLMDTPGDILFLGDFNILSGFQELAPLLQGNKLHLLNREDNPTFRFHRFERVLDLCLCSDNILPRVNLRIIPQPFSDHAALLVEVEAPGHV